MSPEQLKDLILTVLDESKAQEIVVLRVSELTSITDFMIICTGTSSRHVKSVSDHVVEAAKKAGVRPLGVEGEQSGEWVLIDLADAVVHVMLPPIRQFYQLEKLWSFEADAEKA